MDAVDSGRVVTIVVHGTRPAAEGWWWLGAPDTAPTFADRLEDALAARGLPGTVWRPAIAAGFAEASFGWTGRNAHSARLDGARGLVATLQTLAGRLGATPEQPLIFHAIGHSHGGNVILEAIRLMPQAGPVRPGAVVLMGTPLIEMRPALRPFRFLVALAVSLALLASLAVLIFFPHAFPNAVPLPLVARWLLIVAAFAAYRWVIDALAWLGDAAWRVLIFGALLLHGRTAGQVYGPAPDVLRDRLQGRKVVLLTSHQDEADLLAQFTLAPRRLYREWVRARFRTTGRALEWLFVQPLAERLVLGVLETVLERVLGGFDWMRVMLMDHDIADLTRSRAYPARVFERVDVTTELLHATVPSGPAAPRPAQRVEAAGLRGENRQVASLRERLRTAFEYLFTQIHPRHSDYHNTGDVIDRIADAIAAASPPRTSPAP